MSSTSEDSDGDLPAPFLVHLVYRTSAFHRPDEFTPTSLPPHVSFYTWPHCTLSELAMELAASKPSALPYPAIGTRLAFQLVYPDLRGAPPVNDTSPRYAVKDLGSIVIGQGGPGAETSGFGDSVSASRGEQDIGRTLGDARFVVGDYVSCAILPPLSDGSVAPASNARRDVSSGLRDARGQRGGYRGRENGFARGGNHGGRGGRRDGSGGDAPPARPRGGGGRW
ncbi:sin3 associated polypeptide p18 (SAP18) domain-containing protein [Hirsutella rhossiliensis]|uniref:Sin3 associated polypeptide p18 (SAP18) domain-containing protein n=1 Tax=Hirsutella rhossiliensis TaxID=111463 RepID=A0A9P8SFG4_9HYPO|nr:sin3 associated polypeptide p18 (SAP18) domain-containing protein [Hirsutella rhossiliensis]KAH0960019.1 sin3 associated polypeptide p18 (SAP18) domain-containing protein [Hirsutella rhossiliensis]